jgi:hypothetical protein
MNTHVLLVNANRIRPPVAPIAIDCLGTALEDAGVDVRVLDLAWSAEVEADAARALAVRPLLVGLTFRNLDDCSCPSGTSFVAEHESVVELIRRHTDAPIVIGGAGLSIAPGAALGALGADFAVAGEGEAALVALATALEEGHGLERVSGLHRLVGGGVVSNPRSHVNLAEMPSPRRTFVDNRRYFAEGAQVGFETNRGCDGRCTYCADPLLSGRAVRGRSPRSVANELEQLARAGIDVFHTADGEFNVDADHAMAVCEHLATRELGEKIRWYAYCRPDRFPPELARAMRRAGCVGVNFGIDHLDARMLATLGRSHDEADVRCAREACRENGMAVMLDLILGAPGETRRSIMETIETLRAMDPEAVGIAFGLRLYRGTPLADELVPRDAPARAGVRGASPDLLSPAFFVEPSLGTDIGAWLADQVARDARFFYLGAPDSGVEEGRAAIESYNYNANAPLERAIADGARGAYWDILRKLRG